MLIYSAFTCLFLLIMPYRKRLKADVNIINKQIYKRISVVEFFLS